MNYPSGKIFGTAFAAAVLGFFLGLFYSRTHLDSPSGPQSNAVLVTQRVAENKPLGYFNEVPPDEASSRPTQPAHTNKSQVSLIAVPASLAAHAALSVFDQSGLILSKEIIKCYEIDPQDVARINILLKSVISELEELEGQHAQIVTSDDGGKKIEIRAFDAGVTIKNKFSDEMSTILMDERGVSLASLISENPILGGFGIVPRQISITEESDSDAKLQREYVIEIDQYKDNNFERPFRTNSFDFNQDWYLQRFGKLVQ